MTSPSPSGWATALVFLTTISAIGLRWLPCGKGYQFTAWIVASVTAAMVYPKWFLHAGDFDLRTPWLFLTVVQLVMFGMGTQMSWHDFAGLVRSPKGVLVGVLGRFTIMPLAGYALVKIFPFDPAIAAGVILIGSCSSGLASNVMAYLSGANLALSVTVTAMTTVVAVVFTPLWMKLLAGTMVTVDPTKMMLEIMRIVLVPIGAALLHDYLRRAGPVARRRVWLVVGCSVMGISLMVVAGSSGPAANLAGYVFGALIFGASYHQVVHCWPVVDRKMPVLSMMGIVYFTLVTTAAGRDHLLHVGALLFLVAAIHNLIGYVAGYGLGRLVGLDQTSARSLAFETGIQNGGMASGIAGAAGQLGTMGLAPTIFSAWMNISGSVLANHWHKRPVSPNPSNPPTVPLP